MIEQLAALPNIERIYRLNIIDEAMEWDGTPFMHGANIKGVGAECGSFLLGVYQRAGYAKDYRMPDHKIQWHIHCDAPGFDPDMYVREILRFTHEISGPPLPADVVLFWWGHAYAHSAIVIDWPKRLIHCVERGGVQLVDGARDPYARKYRSTHPPRFFSVFRTE